MNRSLVALLAIAGKRIKPVIARTNAKRSMWVGWSRLLQRRAWPAATIGMVLLLALSAPTLFIRLGEADAGSAPRVLTTIDSSTGETDHVWPVVLEDGETVLASGMMAS